MKLEGTSELRAPRERIYQALTDPTVLQKCIPGCERLDKTGDSEYAVTLRAGVGSIKGVFTGSVRLEDMRPPTHYRIVVEGKGQPGFLKGSGDLDLEEDLEEGLEEDLKEQDASTVIKYSGDVQVGGTIAGVGQRMIQGAAKMMAAQFFKAIEAAANGAHEE